ncbi:lysophospholipid acyltransferase family protein [Zooshikella ganghwensis]|uniref:1-acyl-sn-glycerol-3-phosphate acyltransferase n=1 Tax=Zooshikella ganghwensis TaxID=202772 RepID=A0A4P9VSN1_9GAMM|nr:lysophospholipid acyltransferase family protein [Zooshikella ganghwensis]RDH45687.1 1-acyl-sn-glycerol-3-phosphate acyltransferase [Zooshikella ganghwensis]
MINKSYLNLNYYWRIVATGFGFALFGIGGLFIALVIFPFILVNAKSKDQRKLKAQALISKSFRFFISILRSLGVLTLTTANIEKLKSDSGIMVIANHPTLLDVVLLISYLPRVDCVVKEALWHNPFLKRVVQTAGYISNSTPEQLLDDCVDTLKRGNNLLIFPEGTRTEPGKPEVFRRGAANIALRAQVSVRLVYISCQPSALSKSHRWYQVPKRKMHFTIKVGDCLETSNFITKNEPLSISARRLTQYLQKCYRQGEVLHESVA